VWMHESSSILVKQIATFCEKHSRSALVLKSNDRSPTMVEQFMVSLCSLHCEIADDVKAVVR